MNRFGFLKVAAAVPHVRIADCDYNAQHITELIRKGADRGASIILFPELCITSYTCGDLIQQPALLHAAEQALGYILAQTRELPIVAIVGMPVTYGNALYNCAVVFAQGRIHGVVPKTYIPNYSEFYEARCFMSGEEIGLATIRMCGQDTDFGRNMLFNIGGVKFGVEICEDMWVPAAPSLHQAVDGAQILFNLSASPEVLGKHNYLLTLVKSQSARTQSAYIYCSAGYGESSTDLVFGGNGLIVESGRMLRRTERFSTEEQLIVADIDTEKLLNSRRRTTTFAPHRPAERIIVEIPLPENPANVTLDREFSSHPFVPQTPEEMDESGREIINIQTMGLAQRLQHTDCKKVVIGVSGGLDSTLALLIAVRTFDRLGLDRKGIIGVTMPRFGTSNRTYRNSIALMRCLGITSREISIRKACEQHFADIGLNPEEQSSAYENAQARERTQILMDIANMEHGMVLGTGDLSELALGWATYNGDQMSMYGLNASLPKTLIQVLLRWMAQVCQDDAIREILLDVVATPISPELLPSSEEGGIAQHTEAGRALRVARLFPLPLHPERLLPRQDSLRCGKSVRRTLRPGDDPALDAGILPAILLAAVQTLGHARRSESRHHLPLAARRLAYAFGRYGKPVVAGNRSSDSGKIKQLLLFGYEKIAYSRGIAHRLQHTSGPRLERRPLQSGDQCRR